MQVPKLYSLNLVRFCVCQITKTSSFTALKQNLGGHKFIDDRQTETCGTMADNE